MQEKIIGVVGLGYVGLPVAVAMSEKFKVIGFDISSRRITELQAGRDRTEEVNASDLAKAKIQFTNETAVLKLANFFIVAVPTPIDKAQRPDMSLVHAASRTCGECLKIGDIVVYESTVYPGATEGECVPILEETSGLKCNRDFFVGFSPERINPGDKDHTFKKIKKVVSGSNEKSLREISDVYGSVVEAGIHQASSIKVAEASKVIENTQRDLNVAFMNELSMIFNLMGIKTSEVLKAASTKWNFLNFYPGLVGGHCIGVDPFYLTFKAQEYGYHPQVILAGRKINDSMGFHCAQMAIEALIKHKVNLREAKVNLLGLTFKENCPDVRNSRVVDIFSKLRDLQLEVVLHDPRAEESEVRDDFHHPSTNSMTDLKPADVLILAVPHDEYKKLAREQVLSLMKSPRILIDIRGTWREMAKECDYYFSL